MKLTAVVKPVVIGALALVLFVPVSMIQGLIAERQARRNEAVAGIAEGWGGRQILTGPYLAVPYERTQTEVVRETIDGKQKERRTSRTDSLVLMIPADAVEWTIDAKVSERARGIYKARLYSASAAVRGVITIPARFGLPETAANITWGVPQLVVGVADPHGIRSVSPLALADYRHPFEPGPGDAPLPAGVHVPIPELRSGRPQTFEFSFSLEVAGSEALAVAPPGSNTSVTMRSDWQHPSFEGRFLPVRHEIGPAGFSAEWKVSQYAAPDTSLSTGCPRGQRCAPSAGQELGVSFIEPAGLYQRLERASKYGFVFIGLTFAAFLLFELLRRLAIHPIQYAFVGLALAMFFLLLTALSEHIDFAAAYAVATLACVGLIAGYLVRVLRSTPIALAFGCALAALYGMLYAILKAEDYSLLGGSLLLFGLLATAMIATRRIDWYQLAGTRSAAATANG
jgi:inner membrane protein